MTIREISTEVTEEFGWAAAHIVGHIDYWMHNGRSKYRDEEGTMWFHTTIGDLRQKGKLPIAEATIKRAMQFLQKEGVLYSKQSAQNRGKKYKLNYDHPIIQKDYKNPIVELPKEAGSKCAGSGIKMRRKRDQNDPYVGSKRSRPNITTKTTIKKQKPHNPGDSNLVFQGSQEQGKNSEINKTREIHETERRVDASDPKNWKDTDLDHIKSWEDTPSTIAPDTTELFRFGNWQLNKLKSWLSSHEYSTEYLRIIWEQSVADAGEPAQDKKKPRLYLETVFLNKLQNTG